LAIDLLIRNINRVPVIRSMIRTKITKSKVKCNARAFADGVNAICSSDTKSA
jgi:hypothetical protein